MDEVSIISLFQEDKLLVRAMDSPSLQKINHRPVYDFSVWAEEVDIAKNNKLNSVSSTLLVAGENIPTYKNLGFLVDGTKAEIIHVADSDSGSMGNIADGDFRANPTELTSLADLATKTRTHKLRDMNEVNINIKEDALVGLFVNKCPSERPKAFILLAQEYYKLQTGKELPVFIYDSAKGELQPWHINNQEKKAFLQQMLERKKIRSAVIRYEIDNEYTQASKELRVAQTDPIEKNNHLSPQEKIKRLRGLSVSALHKAPIVSDIDIKSLNYIRESKSAGKGA